MSTSLDKTDRLVVRAAARKTSAASRPRLYNAVGSVVAAVGLVLALVAPVVGGRLGLDYELVRAAVVADGTFLVAGLCLWWEAKRFAGEYVVAATDAALRTLEAGDEDRAVLLKAATQLLCTAPAASGQSPVQSPVRTFDAHAESGRLGDRMELVETVQAFLLEEGIIRPQTGG